MLIQWKLGMMLNEAAERPTTDNDILCTLPVTWFELFINDTITTG